MVQIDTPIVDWESNIDHKRSISGVVRCLGLILYIGGLESSNWLQGQVQR